MNFYSLSSASEQLTCRQDRHVVHLFQRQKCVSSASDKADVWFISFRQGKHTFHLYQTRQTCVSSVSDKQTLWSSAIDRGGGSETQAMSADCSAHHIMNGNLYDLRGV
ncbi:hypothetical protein RRG08_033015 [Elysia crispata]|uniref:Uncharacterized protein n=1 Tax=Elysia crispata TaxID=231223 RepID=A0AAE1CKB2_9GAST|nr:hypothetical protein RRG08_033015 [Elysia crispata]